MCFRTAPPACLPMSPPWPTQSCVLCAPQQSMRNLSTMNIGWLASDSATIHVICVWFAHARRFGPGTTPSSLRVRKRLFMQVAVKIAERLAYVQESNGRPKSGARDAPFVAARSCSCARSPVLSGHSQATLTTVDSSGKCGLGRLHRRRFEWGHDSESFA